MGKNKFVSVLSITLFSIGVLLGIALMSITVWADLEAVLFNPQPRQHKPLRSLRCPIIITPEETGIIRARIKNTRDRETDFFIRAHISHGYVTLRREVITEFTLAPGESERVEWEITADDAAFERLVFFRITVKGGYPMPSRQGTCGVLLADVPSLKGSQIVAILLVGSLAFTLGSSGLWFATHREMLELQVQISRAMGFLAVSMVLGIGVSLMGWWVFGTLFLVIVLLAIGVIIGYFVNADTPAA